jgi:hypothetical protein
MQDNALADTVNSCIDSLDEVFSEQIIYWGLWPMQSSDLNPRESSVVHTQRKSACE